MIFYEFVARSNQYISPLLQVIIGLSVTCKQNQYMAMPPVIKAVSQPLGITFATRRYDSVKGILTGARTNVIHIVYSNDRAYPAYLITYSNKI